MEKSLLVGVYELTSPSGKVYVGQSWDIQKRTKTSLLIFNMVN